MLLSRNYNRIACFAAYFAIMVVVIVSLGMPVHAINKAITNYESRVTLGHTDIEPWQRVLQIPNISLDEVGYVPSAKKVFYIQREELLKNFDVIDVSTNKVIYSGELLRLEGREDGTILYLGDFSELTEEGTFRIYQRDVGYSNEFIIAEGLYEQIYFDVQQLVSRHIFITEEDQFYSAAIVLLTEEIYGPDKIDEDLLLKTITYILEEDKERDANQSLLAAGLLAQYAFTHREEAVYGEALRQAEKIYAEATADGESVDVDTLYYASAELYRILGNPKYSTAITDIDRNSLNYEKDYNLSILADMAYLKTKFRTDYDLCERIFKSYVNRAENISSKSAKLYYYVQKDIESFEKNHVLDNMMILGLVSYVLSSHEYLSIQGNYVHYIFGCNSSHDNHYDEVVNKQVKDDFDIVDMCKLLFVLIGGGVRT